METSLIASTMQLAAELGERRGLRVLLQPDLLVMIDVVSTYDVRTLLLQPTPEHFDVQVGSYIQYGRVVEDEDDRDDLIALIEDILDGNVVEWFSAVNGQLVCSSYQITLRNGGNITWQHVLHDADPDIPPIENHLWSTPWGQLR